MNISPSLRSSTPIDVAVKRPLISDLLNVVGFHIPADKKITPEYLASELGKPPVSRLYHDSRLYSVALSFNEKYKQYTYANKSNRQDYLDAILETLTPADVRMLVAYEDEQASTGSFRKIFPTHHTYKYLMFFENHRYYDKLLDAWENRYHDKRQHGIKLLRSLCEKGTHLRTSRRFPKAKIAAKIK